MRTALILVVGLLAAAGCVREADTSQTAQTSRPRSLLEKEQQQARSPFASDRERHDFGDIAIDGGDVETVFRVSNTAHDEVELVAVYTSCGCTSAVLEFDDGSTAGPFGMPGHGDLPEIERLVVPGESFDVRVSFDPAAHGPQGLGNIMRAVKLHARDGGTTELTITAHVVRS